MMKFLIKRVALICIGVELAVCASMVSATPALEAFNSDHFVEAKNLFLLQLQQPENKKTALYYLAAIELSLGEFDKALALTNEALAIEPKLADEYLLLGKIYGAKAQSASMFSALGFAKQCLSSFENGYKVDPNNINILDALIAYHSEAPSIVGGSQAQRDKYLAELKKISPDLATVKEITIFSHQKEQEEALRLAKDLYAKKPLDLKVRFFLGLYFKENKLYAEAEDLYEQLIAVPILPGMVRDERWLITDSYLQLGEVFLSANQHLDRGVSLVEDFQRKNLDPRHIHYFWSFLSLAKLQKANGNMEQYKILVAKINTMNYKGDKYFAKEFEATTKS